MSIVPEEKPKQLLETQAIQAEAANSLNSAFVSANAGTGKTHILVNRVLNLLLDGSEPHRILCLTYTNAAAAEMENRLFDVLSGWATMTDEALLETLTTRLQRTLSVDQLPNARRLFTRAIEAPGGMKVQTIHSFCEKLLQRFPLEAGIAPNFRVLDEGAASELLKKAVSEVMSEALKATASPLQQAFHNIVAHATDLTFHEHVKNALKHKQSLTWMENKKVEELRRTLVAALNLPALTRPGDLPETLSDTLDHPLIAALLPLLEADGGTNNLALARKLKTLLSASTAEEKYQILKDLFLTQNNEKRKKLVTNAIINDAPVLVDRLINAQDLFYDAFIIRESLMVAAATEDLLTLVSEIITRYQRTKTHQSALDYQDLIDKTSNLLTTRASTAWVLYKLDQGLEHILVDEAQDTSPDQWHIVSRLAEEFFSGLGRSESERTLFAVGDEKQSIYGFQGANPREFGAMARQFAKSAKAVDKNFKSLSLNLSFRSTSAVLTAVDLVFKVPALASSLSFKGDAPHHLAHRAGEAGRVEIWPTIKTEESESAGPFAPNDDSTTANPAERLARKISKTIRQWLDESRALPATGRPIQPEDILILVRKRNPFSPFMIRALKAENIPVAGADRIIITKELAVMDMMALGRFLMLPEDDLSLACVLKSPIFNLDDDDLFRLAYRRKRSLWQSLRYFAGREPKFQPVAARLSGWLARADLLPPFEFFAHLLEGEGLRQKFLSRLGAVAGDALDEFLNLSLNYDDQAPPSLEGFLNWLALSEAEIKRDMEKGRNEVRVMTVHGAKGLEAPIVFLPDTCSTGSKTQSESLLPVPLSQPAAAENNENREHSHKGPLLWALRGKGHLPAIEAARGILKREAEEEQARLLYVAMTRARDELYVTGFETIRGRGQGCWYDLINQALVNKAETITKDDGEQILRLDQGQMAGAFETGPESPTTPEHAPLPAWASDKAPPEPHRTIPVAPSSVLPYETPENDEEKLPVEPALLSPAKLGQEGRFLRGRLVHKLLEYLPDLPAPARPSAAKTIASLHGREISKSARAEILAETMNIIEHPDYADLFAEGSRSEVSLMARIEPECKPGQSEKPPILLQGQIDRLVVRQKEVMIIDYKSNRPSPRNPEDVAEAYQAQLAAYRLALREIYPHHTLKAALLWTDGPYLMEIPGRMLDVYENILTGKNL